jgi:hypothetical protein
MNNSGHKRAYDTNSIENFNSAEIKGEKILMLKINSNLAKLDDGLAESPAVMVVDKTRQKKNRKTCENRGILKPSWAFVKTKI